MISNRWLPTFSLYFQFAFLKHIPDSFFFQLKTSYGSLMYVGSQIHEYRWLCTIHWVSTVIVTYTWSPLPLTFPGNLCVSHGEVLFPTPKFSCAFVHIFLWSCCLFIWVKRSRGVQGEVPCFGVSSCSVLAVWLGQPS